MHKKLKEKSLPAILFFSLILILSHSCRRTQYAYFTLSNYSPSVGEQVTCTDVTQNASQYEWQVDGAVFSTEKSPVFVFNQSGKHIIKLIVGKGRKKSERSQSVDVQPQASVVFWQGSADFLYPVGVQISGITKPVIAGKATAPACGDGDCATYTVNAGAISWFAIESAPGTRSWSGTLTAVQNSCTPVLLN